MRRLMVQKAVYWKRLKEDGFGTVIYDAPIEIKVRWDQGNQLITGPDGEQVVSSSQVLTAVDMQVGDFLALTELSGLDETHVKTPSLFDGAYRVLQFTKAPEYASATNFVRTAYL